MRHPSLLLLVPPLILAAAALTAAPRKTHRSGPVTTAREARSIAERDTGGMAVSVREIHLNGASGGWEVDLYMPDEERGWRCIVDNDTHMVHTRTRIPNPPRPGQKPESRRHKS